jgi:hypothetical protein
MRARFVAERGSYDTAYAPKKDWEVLDLARTASRRVIARCSGEDARWIALVLNAAADANVIGADVRAGILSPDEARAELGLPPCST